MGSLGGVQWLGTAWAVCSGLAQPALLRPAAPVLHTSVPGAHATQLVTP